MKALNSLATILWSSPMLLFAVESQSITAAFLAAFGSLIALVVWIIKRFIDVTIPQERAAWEKQNAEDRKTWHEQVSADRQMAATMYQGIIAKLESCQESRKDLAVIHEIVKSSQEEVRRIPCALATECNRYVAAKNLKTA